MADRHIRRLGDDYAAAFTSMLPRGQAWPVEEIDSTLMRVVRGICNFWGFVDGRAGDLLETESDPRATFELLTDWERNWGLPDPCIVEPLTIEDRRKMLVLWMTMLGGQSRQFFLDVAKWLGYTIVITEHAPFMAGVSEAGDTSGHDPYDPTHYRWEIGPPEMRFYWSIHVGGMKLTWFRSSVGQAGIDPHLRIGVATDLECIFERWKPAHTEIVFDYSGIGGIDQYVMLMLYCDGVDGSTAIPDVSQSQHVMTAHGGAHLGTASSKFGSAALVCNGTDSYVDTPDAPDFVFGADDLTVDCWLNVLGGSGTSRFLCGQCDNAGSTGSISIGIRLQPADTMRVALSNGVTLTNIDATTPITGPGWHHFAFVRSGTTCRIYLDGAQVSADITFAGPINDSPNAFAVGRAGERDALYWNGLIDEFRLSVGIARWTAPFTPPSSQYSGSGPMAGTP